ncbi:hypothetical protein MTF65_25775 [Streptomyces sp. APSN-46.1]|uniref:hypothetical protein n=1 Tax=Streptomyces sp. APSN-46.1 TaxID=2929049 RepID=UPI001FB1CB89|nr:hypothetical protein [Streptomyces sp. APSN-46.1]MCJ1680694.1 hypothetical protein [Streptomyces sp. APSN-46.1]
MTEPQNDTNPAPAVTDATAATAVTDATAATAVTDATDATAAPTAGRGKAGPLVVGGLSLAVLVGTGVWASGTIADADRSAPTAYWAPAGAQPPKTEKPGPVPGNPLSAKLLPLPRTYTLGPDLGADGNDFFISGEQAVEGFKEARKGLSSSERKKRDDVLADLELKGQAGRSYAELGGDMVVEVRILQADPKALDSFSEISKKLLDVIGDDDRDAPKVDGFPNAKCSLLAVGEEEEKEKKVDSLYCVAVEGDVMVNFRAYGPKPGFSKSDAAGFLKNQLSHLKSPGESA